MSYISAFADGDIINIVERDKYGNRKLIRDKLEFVFYTLDTYGEYKTIFGEECTKHSFDNRRDFYTMQKKFPSNVIYENDANPVFRYLSKNYEFDEVPQLNIVYYDIEVAYRPETKYSTPDRADNTVISVAVYQNWTEKMYMLTLAPETLSLDEAEKICKEVESEFDNTECILYDNEGDLLKSFLFLIEDSDVITGWNSKMYDFKYLANRIPKIIGPYHLKRLCLFEKTPVERSQYNKKFKREEFYYDCIGRVHLDYMELYKKYTYTELSSYSLDHVSYVELGEKKVEYSGSLDDLFKYDFDNFVRYNIKDTYLVKRLDDVKKFIDLTNLLAHNNGVLMETTLGTVAITEQAILNEGHYFGDETLIFPSKTKEDEDESGAAGAFVSPPQKGIRKMVAGNDINSLYPSAIRALNMSPETLVAQIDTTKTDEYIIEKVESGEAESPREAWGDLFNTFEFDHVVNGTDDEVVLSFNRTDEKMKVPAHKVKDLVFSSSNNLCISANGTIFNTEKIGVIPRLLSRWYSERKEMQAEAEKWEIKMSKETDPEKRAEYEQNFKFWDQRQLAKKINLNALYGALLNRHCRFYDKRLGQSTTLTGRSITRHMSSKINEIILGEYNYLGDSIVYGDTDSSYFSVYEAYTKMNTKESIEQAEKIFSDKDLAIELYNSISDQVNESFPDFMNNRFNSGMTNGRIIKAGRENLADYSLFIKKKRYAMNLIDKDGIRQDVNGKTGKLKVMGIEIKRSDTPKIIQDVLKEGLNLLLQGYDTDKVMTFFVNFKKEFLEKEPWVVGRPSGANAVSYYTEIHNEIERGQRKKQMIPAAIKGAIAWNELLDFYEEDHLPRIGNGSKVIVCPLKPNDFGYDKIAYPTDQTYFPEWFKQLPFDREEMIEKILYKKVNNIFGVLDWDIGYLKANTNFHTMFVEDDD